MRLPSFKRLVKTDFNQEDQQLVEQLSESLNSGVELLHQALNKRLTIGDNLQATERDITISVSTNGTPRSDSFVNVDFGTAVRNVFLGKAENLTNPTNYPTGTPFISWTNTTNGIQILNVTNLVATNTYKLRLVMYG